MAYGDTYESKRAYYLAHREEILAARRVSYAANGRGKPRKALTPEQVDARAERAKAWRLANPERYAAVKRSHYVATRGRAWARNLQNKYGIDAARYEEMLAAQGGVCAICGGKGRRRLAVDHDHGTGRVRGLLCDKCNKAIGLLSDSTETISRALSYLAQNGQEEN